MIELNQEKKCNVSKYFFAIYEKCQCKNKDDKIGVNYNQGQKGENEKGGITFHTYSKYTI